jgi:hypothetical protein
MMSQRSVYVAANGDSWWLCRGHDQVFVLHERSLSSGGKASRIELSEFFSSGTPGPEHQALIQLIGHLVELD